MMGRRSVALLCVLLVHALFIVLMVRSRPADNRLVTAEDFESAPITLYLPPPPPEPEQPAAPTTPPKPANAPPATDSVAPPPSAGQSSAITPPDQVDWPQEGKKAATRVLAREAEAERVARMFAGPGGTWASLTKRQRSKLNKFRFKDGVDGMEYDEKGNQILHVSDGCMIVNSGFFACKIGKVKVRGDMFENMREYFDELRVPETPEGNGTEPEALRPAY
jgi:hypothetical protein